MKLIFSMIIIMTLFLGCAGQQPKAKTVTGDIANLKSASYKLTKDKKLVLKKEYQKKDKRGNIVESKSIVEKVPSFDNISEKSLFLKAKKKKDIYIRGNRVKVSVEDIPLNEFVDLVFGSVLKLNYTVSDDVKQLKTPITLNMQQEQNAKQFYKVVKKILSLKGVKLKNQNNVLFVSKSSSHIETNSGDTYISYGRSLPTNIDDDKIVLIFVPYYYIKAGNTANMLRAIGIKGVQFYYYINSMQTIKGKASDVRKVLKLIKLLDRPYLEGKSSYLINLDNIDVKQFVNKIKQIFTMNGINVTNSPLTGGITMLPIEDLNMLYVITQKKAWLDMLLYWKNKLDIASETSEEPRLYIYHVKNRKADELASAVKEVLGFSKKTTSKKFKTSKNKKQTQLNAKKTTQALLISAGNYTPTVTADKDTNLLMLKLTPKDYRILLPFIQELDKLPLQTLVEVTVADVDMTNTFSLGFEHAIENQSANLVKNRLNISGGGSGLGIVFKGNYLDSTINAYAEKKLLDILSRPRILILNNHTGTINVGTQVPIVTSEVSTPGVTTTTAPAINRNITYRTTGINLGLTPTINSNGVLTMNISINLSEAQLNDTSGIDSPLIVNRSLNTVAVINSGDTILVGGLISHNNSKNKGGVPILKDIPYIGSIFSNVSHKVVKTELIMLIRPTIIKTQQEMSSETYKFKKILNLLESVNL